MSVSLFLPLISNMPTGLLQLGWIYEKSKNIFLNVKSPPAKSVKYGVPVTLLVKPLLFAKHAAPTLE